MPARDASMTRARLARSLLPLWLLIAGTARAAPEVDPGPWRQLGVELESNFPIDVGGKLWLELPHRLRLSTSFGYWPNPYIATINGSLVSEGAYSQDTASLIATILTRSFVWRLHVGWRPWAQHGAYFEIGYALTALGGVYAYDPSVERGTGVAQAFPNYGYRTTATLHMLDLELGWMWQRWRGLTVRTAVGFAGTVGADVTIARGSSSRSLPSSDALTHAASAVIAEDLRSHLFTPVVTLGIGWRIF